MRGCTKLVFVAGFFLVGFAAAKQRMDIYVEDLIAGLDVLPSGDVSVYKGGPFPVNLPTKSQSIVIRGNGSDLGSRTDFGSPPDNVASSSTLLYWSTITEEDLSVGPVLKMGPGQELTLTSLSLYLATMDQPFGYDVTLFGLALPKLFSLNEGSTLNLIDVTLVVKDSLLRWVLASLCVGIDRWPYNPGTEIRSDGTLHLANLTTRSVDRKGKLRSGGMVRWINVTIRCTGAVLLWPLPCTAAAVSSGVELMGAGVNKLLSATSGPVFVHLTTDITLPPASELNVTWSPVTVPTRCLLVLLGNPSRRPTLDLAGVEGAWRAANMDSKTELYGVVHMYDLTLVNQPYTTTYPSSARLLTSSLPSFGISWLNDAQYRGYTALPQLVALRCTLVVPDEEVAYFTGMVQRNQTLLRVKDVQIAIEAQSSGCRGAAVGDANPGKSVALCPPTAGQLEMMSLTINLHVKLLKSTLLSASIFQQKQDAIPLLPGSLIWLPLVMHRNASTALRQGPVGLRVYKGWLKAFVNILNLANQPEDQTVTGVITRTTVDEAKRFIGNSWLYGSRDTIRRMPPSSFVITGCPEPVASNRTFINLKGQTGWFEIVRPMTLRNVVLYNLVPGGATPIPEAPVETASNSTNNSTNGRTIKPLDSGTSRDVQTSKTTEPTIFSSALATEQAISDLPAVMTAPGGGLPTGTVTEQSTSDLPAIVTAPGGLPGSASAVVMGPAGIPRDPSGQPVVLPTPLDAFGDSNSGSMPSVTDASLEDPVDLQPVLIKQQPDATTDWAATAEPGSTGPAAMADSVASTADTNTVNVKVEDRDTHPDGMSAAVDTASLTPRIVQQLDGVYGLFDGKGFSFVGQPVIGASFFMPVVTVSEVELDVSDPHAPDFSFVREDADWAYTALPLWYFQMDRSKDSLRLNLSPVSPVVIGDGGSPIRNGGSTTPIVPSSSDGGGGTKLPDSGSATPIIFSSSGGGGGSTYATTSSSKTPVSLTSDQPMKGGPSEATQTGSSSPAPRQSILGPRLVLENVTLVIPEHEWRAMVAAILLYAAPEAMAAAAKAQQQQQPPKVEPEQPVAQVQQQDKQLGRLEGQEEAQLAAGGRRRLRGDLQGYETIQVSERRGAATEPAGLSRVVQRHWRRLSNEAAGEGGQFVDVLDIVDVPKSSGSYPPGDSPAAAPVAPLSTPSSPSAPRSPSLPNRPTWPSVPNVPPVRPASPPPPPPPPPSPPLQLPPTAASTREALLAFGAISKVESYDYSAGVIVLSTTQHYGWTGTNVALTFKLPEDAPPGARLVGYTSDPQLPYEDLAEDMNLDVEWPPSGGGSVPWGPTDDTTSEDNNVEGPSNITAPAAPPTPSQPDPPPPPTLASLQAPSPPPQQQPSNDNSGGRPAWVIPVACTVGIVGGLLVIGALLAACCCCCYSRRPLCAAFFGRWKASQVTGTDSIGRIKSNRFHNLMSSDTSPGKDVAPVVAVGQLASKAHAAGTDDALSGGGGHKALLSHGPGGARVAGRPSHDQIASGGGGRSDRHSWSTSAQDAQPASSSMRDSVRALQAELRDWPLEVKTVIDCGASGVVYGGMWRGLLVAIKTLVVVSPEATTSIGTSSGTADPRGISSDSSSNSSDLRMLRQQHRAVLEAAISLSLEHPNVVATYTYDLKGMVQKPVSSGEPSVKVVLEDSVGSAIGTASANEVTSVLSEASPSTSVYKLYIVQEFCNGGSMRSALSQGKAGCYRDGGVQRSLALSLALQVAQGMSHLHAKRIVHGDLKPANVLLSVGSTIEGDGVHVHTARHGDLHAMGMPYMEYDVGSAHLQLTAKVADFGLSLPLAEGATHASNRFHGTPAYTAPEVLSSGRLSPHADVWSFGVLLLELYHGRPLAAHSDSPAAGAAAAALAPGLRAGPGALLSALLKDAAAEAASNVDAATVDQEGQPSPAPGVSGGCQAYAELVRACLVAEPKMRPDFPGIASRLEHLLGLA